MPLYVDGDLLQDEEVHELLRMIDHDCKEHAGNFFEQDRSAKFRKTWKEVGELSGRSPQDCFVDHSWKHFHLHVKTEYSYRLKLYIDEKLKLENPCYEKDANVRHKLFQALIVMGMMSQAAEAKDVLQMAPGTQAFEGDKAENKHIAETYGNDATIH